jgi:hypothetical protein
MMLRPFLAALLVAGLLAVTAAPGAGAHVCNGGHGLPSCGPCANTEAHVHFEELALSCVGAPLGAGLPADAGPAPVPAEWAAFAPALWPV